MNIQKSSNGGYCVNSGEETVFSGPRRECKRYSLQVSEPKIEVIEVEPPEVLDEAEFDEGEIRSSEA